VDGAQLVDNRGLAQALRLAHLQAALEREALHRARARTQAAAGGPVGLREDQGDVVTGLEQPDQAAFRESGSPRED
jgi:hypothetical protein